MSKAKAKLPDTITGALVSNEAVKADAEKVRLELLPIRAITEVGKVLTFGGKKYGADNWRLGMQWRRLIGAAFRHLFAFARGEDRDPETGLPHLAHATCCLLFLLTYQLEGLGHDDRTPEGDA